MRKLTVKNFSVIKDSELEFGRITVLIGPQAEGKSLLCKLSYFLGAEIIGFAVDSLLDRNSWDEYLHTVVREFNSRFATDGWLKNSTVASFESQQYNAKLRGVGDPLSPGVEFTFSEAFHQLYTILNNKVSLQAPYKNMALSELRQELWMQFSLSRNLTLPGGETRSLRVLFGGFWARLRSMECVGVALRRTRGRWREWVVRAEGGGAIGLFRLFRRSA